MLRGLRTKQKSKQLFIRLDALANGKWEIMTSEWWESVREVHSAALEATSTTAALFTAMFHFLYLHGCSRSIFRCTCSLPSQSFWPGGGVYSRSLAVLYRR
jgi:hypothetical protein